MWQWLVVMVLLDVVAWGQPTCTAGGRAPVFFLCLKLCTWLFSDQNLINKKHFVAHIGQHQQMMSYLESLQSNSSCTCIRWDEETTIIGIVTFFRLKDNLSLFLSELIIEKWNVKLLRMCKTVAFTALKLQQSQYIVCRTAELFRLSQRSLSLIMWYGTRGSVGTSPWPWYDFHNNPCTSPKRASIILAKHSDSEQSDEMLQVPVSMTVREIYLWQLDDERLSLSPHLFAALPTQLIQRWLHPCILESSLPSRPICSHQLLPLIRWGWFQ